MPDTTHERPVLLTQREAAELLGVSRRTMQRLFTTGALEPVRIVGLGRPRYRRADLERFAQGERAGP
jgi:excisionase family DNA binding protein